MDDSSLYSDSKTINGKAQRNLRILELLRRKGPLSRTDISKVSGINPVTVSHYVDKLISNDFVYEKEFDVSTGGRRPLLLDINPKAAYTIGIGVNLFGCTGVLVDLDGNVIYRCKVEKKISSPNDFLESVIALSDEMFANTRSISDKIKGIGIGLGGIIDEENQVIRWPSDSEDGLSYSYVSMPLKSYFSEKFDLPVFIANDANLACFAEHWLTLDADTRDVIYMHSGVACGIMINGEVYRGKHGCAGELFINCADSDLDTYLGSFSFFKQWSHDLGLIKRVNALLDDRYPNVSKAETLKDVFSIHVDGVNEIIDDAAHVLGIKIAFLVNVLNPEVIIIGGGMEHGGYTFIEKINSYVKKYAFDEMIKNLKIIASGLGDEAVSLGAANMVVKKTFAAV